MGSRSRKPAATCHASTPSTVYPLHPTWRPPRNYPLWYRRRKVAEKVSSLRRSTLVVLRSSGLQHSTQFRRHHLRSVPRLFSTFHSQSPTFAFNLYSNVASFPVLLILPVSFGIFLRFVLCLMFAGCNC